MKKYNNFGFTLVELIVVIIVLSILSTLGFVSYQGYSVDARDAKRKADVGNLTKQLELRKIDGEDLFLFALDDSSSIDIDIQIAGYVGGVDLGGNYKAGDADFVYLELVGENFTDPLTGDPYKVGITSYQNRYEVAASIEQNGAHGSYVDGTWLPRSVSDTQVELDRVIGNTLYLSGITKSDLLLYAGDRITVDSNPANLYEITRVFHTKIQVDRSLVLTGSTMELFVDESEHIIKSWSGDYPILTNSGTMYTPYNLQP